MIDYHIGRHFLFSEVEDSLRHPLRMSQVEILAVPVRAQIRLAADERPIIR